MSERFAASCCSSRWREGRGETVIAAVQNWQGFSAAAIKVRTSGISCSLCTMAVQKHGRPNGRWVVIGAHNSAKTPPSGEHGPLLSAPQRADMRAEHAADGRGPAARHQR